MPARRGVGSGWQLLLLGLAVAAAQPAGDFSPGPDSSPRQDTVVRGESVATQRAGRRQKSPGRAVLLSLLLPGGGQVYTGEWWRALVIAPAEVTLGYLTYRTHLAASAALGRGDSTDYAKLRDRRTALFWWTGAVIVFSMADAYVSAQLYGLDQEMQFAGPVRRWLRARISPTGLGFELGL